MHLAEIASALALAADLAIGQPFDHVLRCCAIAMRFADHLDLSTEDRDATYWVALLIIPGCTAVSFELSRLFGDDIALRAAAYAVAPSMAQQMRYMLGRAGGNASLLQKTRVRAELLRTRMRPLEDAISAHCAINVRLAEGMGLGPAVTSALAQSFARWDGNGIPSGVGGHAIALPVRIASLADMVEVAHREQGVQATIDVTWAWSGIRLDPDLVAAWHGVASEILEAVDGEAAAREVMSAGPNRSLAAPELESALELLADYADLKSPWFLGHSRGTSALAAAAAGRMGLPAGDVTIVRQAALVHDLGRTGVPNSIWDKPGLLSNDEFEQVRLHAYYTGRVLHRAGRLAYLSSIASAGHERVDGSGYPRGIAGETIPLLGRVMECADTYHAMTEDRPHRPALARDAAAGQLRGMARQGLLDGASVDAVLAAAGHSVRRRPSAPAGLTPREVEVLEHAARGVTTKELAARLGISPKTAGNHIERIYMKIGVTSRAEAALFAMQNGLLRVLEL